MGATIAAISSPPGGARRGVIRLSGPEAAEILAALVAPRPGAFARGAFTARLDDGTGTQPALCLCMPGPASYTREDVVELHLPGSPFLLQRALQRVLSLGARPALPGEFTRRAFLNGRLDLSRAEGVLALTEAVDEAERKAALGLFAGGLGSRVDELRDALAELCGLVEASLDFDEEDTGAVPFEELDARLHRVQALLAEALSFEVRRQPPTSLPRVALVGPPNAGKSTLFNALAGARALTSELAGTTRDLLHAHWALEGLPSGGCRLCDTPGLDSGTTGVDRTAQERARVEVEGSDLLLVVVDARAGLAPATSGRLPDGMPRIVVWNQCDRPDARPVPEGRLDGAPVVAVSARRAEGLGELAAAVEHLLGALRATGRGSQGEVSRLLFARHRRALERASDELREAAVLLEERGPLDLAAQGLRQSLDALDDLSGRTTAEDLLDRIFARFCLGK